MDKNGKVKITIEKTWGKPICLQCEGRRCSDVDLAEVFGTAFVSFIAGRLKKDRTPEETEQCIREFAKIMEEELRKILSERSSYGVMEAEDKMAEMLMEMLRRKEKKDGL